MSKPIDMIGQRLGRLVVIERAEDHICAGSGERKRRWKCMCDCGEVTYATTGDLRKGDKTSCGCYLKESRVKNTTTHGLSGTKLHHIWKAMRRRCSDCNQNDYRWYGGKGVKVCEDWNNDFMEFYNWAINNVYMDGLTIDRIDSDGDYCPENCRWATMKEQCNNRTNKRELSIDGETHSITEWSNITGIPYQTIYMRIYNGWDADRVLEPVGK